MDQAARVHLYPLPFGRLHPPCRQLSHHRQFFGQPHPPPRIPLREQVFEKLRILGQTSKVTAPAQQECLLHRSFKPVMTLLDVAVLVWTHRGGMRSEEHTSEL